MNKQWSYKSPGIPDDFFIRGKVPMTKEEVRAVTISKLRIDEGSNVLDIGAGTGSVTIEMALQAAKGKVFAIEKNSEGVQLIKSNVEKFRLENVIVKQGIAPDDCIFDNVKFDRVFMGGTSGRMNEILKWCKARLTENGRVVVNTITIENTYKAIQALKDLNYQNIDVAQVQVSKGRFVGSVTMMESNNPVYIISADR